MVGRFHVRHAFKNKSCTTTHSIAAKPAATWCVSGFDGEDVLNGSKQLGRPRGLAGSNFLSEEHYQQARQRGAEDKY